MRRFALLAAALALSGLLAACAAGPEGDGPEGEPQHAAVQTLPDGTVIDLRHLVPAFDPRLDAVHAPRGFGTGRIWHVGPTRSFTRPSEVARLVRDGDIVAIDAARYRCDTGVRWRANRLTLVGIGGRPVIDAEGCGIAGGKGIWNPAGSGLIVENVAFRGAEVGAGNGAGIRYDGSGYVYIAHSIFERNQDGILFTPRPRADTDLVIEKSAFSGNGTPDGRAHNMYISQHTGSFVLRFSHSHGAHSGHEVKTRARTNLILYNRLDDGAGGNASYELDVPQGGLTYVLGNLMEKGPHAENPSVMSYAVEERAPNPVQKLFVVGNTIINHAANEQQRRVLFIRDRGLSDARFLDNLVVGVPREHLLFAGRAAAVPQVRQAGNVLTDRPGFVDAAAGDFQLMPGSPAIGAAVDPGSADGFSLAPAFQYQRPLGAAPRSAGSQSDAGAFGVAPGREPEKEGLDRTKRIR